MYVIYIFLINLNGQILKLVKSDYTCK